MKTMIKVMVGLLALGVIVSPAAADIYVGKLSVTWQAGYYTAPGGEFTLGDSALSNSAYHADARDKYAGYANDFQSFCLEFNEHIGIPSIVYAVISTSGPTGSQAVKGGAPVADPLDPMTAYLYTRFAKGVLNGYDYVAGSGREASAKALQNAIWFIEGEVGSLDLGLATQFYNDAVAAGWTTIGNVRVLNLYANADYTGLKQDQLYLVPAPAAVGLGLLGLGLVGWVKRRMA